MAKKRTVQFKAHKKEKVPTEIKFKTKAGEKVDFVAEKTKNVPVRVKFKAKPKS